MFRNFIPAALFITLLMALPSFAQQKTLSIDDLMNRKLYPQSLNNVQWRDNNRFVWNVRTGIVQQDAKSGNTDTILTRQELATAFAKKGFKEPKSVPGFVIENIDILRITNDSSVLRYNLASKELTIANTYPADAENATLEPVTGKMAFTKENNLFVSENGRITAVTNDADKGIVNGQSVHRNEFGINGGIFWSPKGNLLAFYRMDETMVTQYPLVDINARIAEVKYTRYPMAGMKSHHVTVGVFNPVSQVTIFLKTGEPAEQYLTNVSWSPDEKYIFIAVVNRDQNHMWLNKYDATTGDFVKTLFEETDKEYVEPMNPLYFMPNSADKFIWQSRRDGWNHLYLYDTEGNLLKQLTSGNWEVTDITGTDARLTRLYFLSTQESPLERHLYSVDLKKGTIIKHTSGKGTHTCFVSPDGKFILDRYSNLELASRTILLNDKAKTLKIVSEDVNPLKDYSLGETSLVTLKASDGCDLFGRLIKPADFDSTKKYPVLVYVYGGPHSQMVTNTWLAGAGLYLNYLAAKDYIVWTLDNHGTSNRGADFEQTIHRRLGDKEAEDQMTGVAFIKSLPYVDTSRIGVEGWSYGGFMTLTLKTRYPDVFKVAACGGPVVDWKYYEVMYGERYMDTPEENPEGYQKACLLNYTDHLKGKVMIIHGAQDPTVVWQNSLQYIQSCIKKGKQVDYFVYPNHEHNVNGADRLHLYRKFVEYYEQNL